MRKIQTSYIRSPFAWNFFLGQIFDGQYPPTPGGCVCGINVLQPYKDNRGKESTRSKARRTQTYSQTFLLVASNKPPLQNWQHNYFTMTHIPSLFVGSVVSGATFLLIHRELSHRERLSARWILAERAEEEVHKLWSNARSSLDKQQVNNGEFLWIVVKSSVIGNKRSICAHIH